MSVIPQVIVGTSSIGGRDGETSRAAFNKFNTHTHTEYASNLSWTLSVDTYAQLQAKLGAATPDGQVILVKNGGLPSLFAYDALSTLPAAVGITYVPIDNIGRWKKAIPLATSAIPGIVKSDGVTTNISADGTISVIGGANSSVSVDNFSITRNNLNQLSTINFAATNTVLGHVKPDIATISVNASGTLTANDYAATNNTRGHVRVDGNSIVVDSAGIISLSPTPTIRKIILNDTTNPTITFNNASLASPSFTNRSNGTRLILNQTLSPTSTDYAIGLETNALWLSSNNNNSSIKFYNGTTNTLNVATPNTTLNSNLIVNGSINLQTPLNITQGGTSRNNIIEVADDLSYADAGPNLIINGLYQDLSRGKGPWVNPVNNIYYPNRFVFVHQTGTPTGTLEVIPFTLNNPPPINYAGLSQNFNFVRYTKTSNATSSYFLGTRLENSLGYSQQTFTLSVYVRSSVLGNVNLQASLNFGIGGNAPIVVDSTSRSITTIGTWQRITSTFTVPNLNNITTGTGSYGISLGIVSSLQGALDTWGWQLKKSSLPGALELISQTENSLKCMRYFQATPCTINFYADRPIDYRYNHMLPVPMLYAPVRLGDLRTGTALNIILFYPNIGGPETGATNGFSVLFNADGNCIGFTFFLRAPAPGYCGLFDWIFGMDSEIYA
jgi:hypothetical protein